MPMTKSEQARADAIVVPQPTLSPTAYVAWWWIEETRARERDLATIARYGSQQRADAMADAETLRLACFQNCRACEGAGQSYFGACGDCGGTGVIDSSEGLSLLVADAQGHEIVMRGFTAPLGTYLGSETPDQIYARGLIAARAAFRAVPGLRGDR